MLAALHAHRRAQRADREQSASESDQQGARPEQQWGLERRREHDGGERRKPEHGTDLYLRFDFTLKAEAATTALAAE
jgi:hypothetical protein